MEEQVKIEEMKMKAKGFESSWNRFVRSDEKLGEKLSKLKKKKMREQPQ